ncbi:hypothetical protein PT974_06100 [Cladobotryum mycophilum]|uniref:Uncharacterized protein n=1 Tax=Cladobotryum mycophilum TaxID=491253 RepID=A0ABR0SLQ8_9HYPO
MTIDEARLILGIDQITYRILRSTFQRICHEESLFKKTVAGQEKWEGAKDRVVNSIPELQRLLWLSGGNLEHKRQAFDVICTDVTKRIRMLESRMSLADAKNTLGVNPQQSREIRIAFHEVLSDVRLNCKSDVSPQQWEDLKHRWAGKSALIKRISDDITNTQDPQKSRALDMLARDVMKRLRDRARKEPKKNQGDTTTVTTTHDQNQDQVQNQIQDQIQDQLHDQLHDQIQDQLHDRLHNSAHDQIHHSTHDSQDMRSNGTSHSQTPPLTTDQIDLGDDMTPSNFDDMSEVSHASHMAFSSPSDGMTTHLPLSMPSQESSLSDSRDTLPSQSRVLESSIPPGMQLDPQLSSSLLLGTTPETAFLDQSYVSQQYGAAASPSQVFQQCPPPIPTACAIYLRLHPSSTFVASPPLWIATINSHSVQGLRQAAVERFPGALCLRVEGILKYDKCGELPLPIEQDQELAAYLAHLQGAAPTFNVQLVWKPS